MSVTAADGAPNLRGLLGAAFAESEPALPDLDDVIGEIELLGGRLRRRQRVRTGVATAVLCVTAFGMVTGIDYVIHTNTTTTVNTVPVSGGDQTGDQSGDQDPSAGHPVNTGQ